MFSLLQSIAIHLLVLRVDLLLQKEDCEGSDDKYTTPTIGDVTIFSLLISVFCFIVSD